MMDLRNIEKPEKFTMKQVIILRRDLKMKKGKLVAQGAHASVAAVLDAAENHLDWLDRWLNEGFKKVVLRVDSLEELEKVFQKASKKGLPCAIISDFGLTELEPGTVTAVAIGPAPVVLVDKITHDLKLL